MNHQARVYRNLNNGLWSIKQKVDGKWVVVGHASEVALNHARPHVSKARHKVVRNGGHREVFAWLEGSLISTEGFVSYQGRLPAFDMDGTRENGLQKNRITFHPHEEREFFWADMGSDFIGAFLVKFYSDSTVWGA